MNLRRVLRILGIVLFVLSAAQLVPLLGCLSPPAWLAAKGLLTGAATSAALGVHSCPPSTTSENQMS